MANYFLLSDNSSRFGKWMKVNFDNSFRIQGCEIVNYLLEKSRVVYQNPNERNYHIFYQLLNGADSKMKSRLQLKNPNDFHYLNQSGCSAIDGVDDRAEFMDVLQALETLQFPAEITDCMMRIFAGILHLGNVLFESGSSRDVADSKLKGDTVTHLHTAAEMFGVDPEILKNSLIGSVVQSGRGSIIRKLLSPEKAMETRDTVAKALYGNLFDWTIKKVNLTLKTDASPFFIGILDIFGFEIFEINSFEQLCINYANEKLQYHFNEVIFSGEMAMYEEEGIATDKIEFEDNGHCVSLIEAKGGLLSLLEDECQSKYLDDIIVSLSHILKTCRRHIWNGFKLLK
jgi:myosin heavy subunit